MAKKNDLLGQALEAKRQLSFMTQKYHMLREAVFRPEVVLGLTSTLGGTTTEDQLNAAVIRGQVVGAALFGYRTEIRLHGECGVRIVFVANPKE